MKRFGFTLVEVLITLAIVGIVAVLIMPTLIVKIQDYVNNAAKQEVERKFKEATSRMKSTDALSGYASTEEFMQAFKKYMIEAEVCTNANFKKCYPDEIYTAEGKKVDVSTLKVAGDFGHADWNTNIIGFVMDNGTTVLIAYDPDCTHIEPTDNTSNTLACIGFVYDINGKKQPNKITKDVSTVNATLTTCDGIKIGSLCADLSDTPYSNIDTCDNSPNKIYDPWGSQNANCASNSWAGAMKACQDKGMRLPTVAEVDLMNKNAYLIGGTNYTHGGVFCWTSEEVDANRAILSATSAPPRTTVSKRQGSQYPIRCVR